MSKLLLHRAQPVVLAARSGLLLPRRIGAPTTPAATGARGFFLPTARPHRQRSTTRLFSAPASSSWVAPSAASLLPLVVVVPTPLLLLLLLRVAPAPPAAVLPAAPTAPPTATRPAAGA